MDSLDYRCFNYGYYIFLFVVDNQIFLVSLPYQIALNKIYDATEYNSYAEPDNIPVQEETIPFNKPKRIPDRECLANVLSQKVHHPKNRGFRHANHRRL